MTNYRRSYDGTTYFFTVVTKGRQGFLCTENARRVLRNAVATTRRKHPFAIDGWVLLPDHLHCIWTLPDEDRDYSKRWSAIKARFSRGFKTHFRPNKLSGSAAGKREAGIWQRRFWARKMMDERDFGAHMDYIHYNPVKHGLAKSPTEWPWSTFHRWVHRGVYEANWGAGGVTWPETAGSE